MQHRLRTRAQLTSWPHLRLSSRQQPRWLVKLSCLQLPQHLLPVRELKYFKHNCQSPIIWHRVPQTQTPGLQGGLRPHAFCLPVLKRETHRQAVLAAATSGSPRFFLGTDSAPHPKHAKVQPTARLASSQTL